MAGAILALDPGTDKTAWMLFDGKPVDHGIESNQDLLNNIVCWAPKILVYEMIASQGMAVGKETFETVFWIGRFHEAAESCAGKCHRIYRQECKLHLCNSVRAKDANIRQALIDLYGGSKEKAIGTKKAPGPLYGVSSHCWSALAVAKTWWDLKREVADVAR